MESELNYWKLHRIYAPFFFLQNGRETKVNWTYVVSPQFILHRIMEKRQQQQKIPQTLNFTCYLQRAQMFGAVV